MGQITFAVVAVLVLGAILLACYAGEEIEVDER